SAGGSRGKRDRTVSFFVRSLPRTSRERTATRSGSAVASGGCSTAPAETVPAPTARIAYRPRSRARARTPRARDLASLSSEGLPPGSRTLRHARSEEHTSELHDALPFFVAPPLQGAPRDALRKRRRVGGALDRARRDGPRAHGEDRVEATEPRPRPHAESP